MNIYEKINAIMGEVKSLGKDGNVNFNNTNYNYLSESKTTAIFHELFFKYKVAMLPIAINERKEGQITYGHYTYKLINCEDPDDYIILETTGQGHDSADKGSGKASSYAYKYLIWRTFAIPSNDDADQMSSEELLAKEKAAAEAKEKAKAEAKAKSEAQKMYDETTPINADQISILEKLIKACDADRDSLLLYFNVKDISELMISGYKECKHLCEIKIKKFQEQLLRESYEMGA